MTEPQSFKDLMTQAMSKRSSMRQDILQRRDDIASALRGTQDACGSWRAEPPDEDVVDNVTKRLNVCCETTFRLHLIIHDGGRVLFPKIEANDPFTASNSAEALTEIARRCALHRMPDEAAVVRRSIQAR